ncbi:MAG: MFS transporter [Lachnospiraceae bacterium]
MDSTKKVSSDFGRKGWEIIIFVFFLYMFSSTPPDTLNVTADFFAVQFNMSSSNALLLFSAIGGFAGIPISLLFGIIIAKKGVKIPTIGILLIYALTWLLYGNASNIAMYGVIVILITAISNSINLVSTQQIMSNWFPKKKGIALGWATMGMCFSSAIMVGVFHGMISNISLSAPFYLMIVICILLAAVTLFWFKAYPEEANAYPDNEKVSDEETKRMLKFLESYKSEWTAGKLLKTKEFWSLVFIFGFLFIGLVGTVSQMIPRLVSVGMETTGAIMWLTIASVIGIPASFIWGYIDQKIGTKKAVEIFCILWTIMMAVAALGAQMVNLPISILSVIMYACLLGGLGNLMPSMVIQIFGRFDFAQANKLVVPFVVGLRSFALIIVPIMLQVAGIGHETIGFRNVFLIFTVMSAIAILLAVRLKDTTIGYH